MKATIHKPESSARAWAWRIALGPASVLDGVVELLEAQKYLLEMRPSSDAERKKALQIIMQGHEKSGYPSIYDALFHAMALCNNAIFVTADKRHFAKTQQLGSVCLLSELVFRA